MLRLLLFLFAASCLAQTTKKPSLDELIDEALARNLRLMSTRYSIPIAEARIIQARLRPNPSLLLQWQYVDVFGRGFSAESNPAGPPEVDVGILLPIVRGGKRAARIEMARWAKASTEADFLNATRLLVLDVQSAYIDYLLMEDNMQLYEASQKAFERVVEVNRTRVNAGDLAKVELVRTEVAFIQYQNQVLQASQRFRQAKFRLQAVVGRTVLSPDFDVDGDFRRGSVSQSLDQLIASALEQRPDLLSARRDVNRAKGSLALEKADAKQDWALYAWVNRQYSIGIKNGTSMTMQLNAPLPVSDRNQGEIERARQEMEQSESLVKALEQEIRAELTAAHAQYQTTLTLLERIESSLMDRAKQARDTTQYSYLRGEATLVEFLDAQRVYNDTMQAYNEARAEHARSLNMLDALSGGNRP